jgi:hypothetical protein
MAEKQESSNVDIDNVDNIDNPRNIDRDNFTELPLVDVLTTLFPPNSIHAHAATLRKLKEQKREIQEQQRQIQELTFDMAIKDAHMQTIRHAAIISRTPSLPPVLAALLENPGPHRLLPKPERPEDIAYKAKLIASFTSILAFLTAHSLPLPSLIVNNETSLECREYFLSHGYPCNLCPHKFTGPTQQREQDG